jgi:hypothetical protein
MVLDVEILRDGLANSPDTELVDGLSATVEGPMGRELAIVLSIFCAIIGVVALLMWAAGAFAQV